MDDLAEDFQKILSQYDIKTFLTVWCVLWNQVLALPVFMIKKSLNQFLKILCAHVYKAKCAKGQKN